MKDIDRSHEGFGWLDIGYHGVIEEHACFVPGRALWRRGAHTKGFNRSLGLCIVGDFNTYDPDPDVWSAALAKVQEWRYLRQPRTNPIRVSEVRGHWEVNTITSNPKYRTRKTCPGARWPMNQFRTELMVLDRQFAAE